MRLSFEHAATCAALVLGTSCLPASAADTKDVGAYLRSIDARAVPMGYSGEHSTNLNHLQPIKADSAKQHPAQAASTMPAKVDYSKKYYRALYRLHDVCPALAKISIQDFNAAAWFNAATAADNLREMKRGFIEQAYFTIGSLPDSAEKTKALAALNLAIPDSPAFVAYIQAKRDELAQKLENDPEFRSAENRWHTMTERDQQKFLTYLSRTILDTLLPGHDIEYPRIMIVRGNRIGPATDALYEPEFNETYVNGDTDESKLAFRPIVETVIHEVFHTFQNILAAWYIEDKLVTHPELERQGRLMFEAGLRTGTGIEAEADYKGYRTGPKERSAWAFQLAAMPVKSPSIETDYYIDRDGGGADKIANPPPYKADPNEGTLPAACLQ